MTQEEKAKAYDKAIERAKEYNFDGAKQVVKDLVTYIFPELKESEDERIRNFLHHTFTAEYLSEDKLSKWHGEPVANILAWLEKQVSPDMVADAYLRGCNDTEKKLLKKQNEQKPATWSKEDEDYRLDVNAAVDCYFGDIYAEELRDWLKSLEGRIQPQPKQEWSEEDDSILNELIKYFESLLGCIATEERHKENRRWLNWLKLLKGRYTWKPSDEQLNALHDAAVYVEKSMFPYPKGILMKLYKQLKKLKG